MYNSCRLRVLVLGLIMIGCMAGCGANNAEELAFLNNLVPATGHVTLKGQPLSGATVTFFADTATKGARDARAVTDANGGYELITRVPGVSQEKTKGALPGAYVVTISKITMPDGAQSLEEGATELDAIAAGAVEAVPEKYTDPGTTTLKVTVAAPKAENDFEL